MSVPAIITLTYVSVVERVESYILNLVKHFYKARHFTSTIFLDGNKAVLPALNHRVNSIVTSTYKYDLSFGHKMA